MKRLINFQSMLLFSLIFFFVLFFQNGIYSQCTEECDGISNTTAYGWNAGVNGIDNTFFGSEAGSANSSTGNFNSFFGSNAGNGNTGGDNNSFFGYNAGQASLNSSDNAFFGYEAGFSNNFGSSNAFYGKEAGYANQNGNVNAFFGTGAGYSNSSGSRNAFFGRDAGRSNTFSSNNSFFGHEAGYSNTKGSENCFFGQETGFSNVNGSYNAFFGESAGVNANGSGNVILGYGAGPTNGNSDINLRLYIDVDTNSTSGNDEPLIYGEFDNDFVKINGTFEVTAGLMNPSSVDLKEGFTPIDQEEILSKVASLEIMEWSYITDPDVRHAGPTAEDFYEAFGLGQGSKTISTMDADGVALIAVQALNNKVELLSEENASLKKENKQLNEVIHSLVQRIEKLEGK